MPGEYLEFILCRDVYHCTPSQLKQEKLTDILRHIACMSIEAEVRDLKEGGGTNNGALEAELITDATDAQPQPQPQPEVPEAEQPALPESLRNLFPQ